MEHGGGFIFDCRCIINPGIIPEMQSLNGKDQLVIQYLKHLRSYKIFKLYV